MPEQYEKQQQLRKIASDVRHAALQSIKAVMRYPNEMEMVEMHASDFVNYFRIALMVEAGDVEAASRLVVRLDTAARDVLPNSLFDLTGAALRSRARAAVWG